METNYLVLNMEIIKSFTQRNGFNTLWAYSVSSYLMRGLGYFSKREFIQEFEKFTGKSDKTCYRYISLLIKENLLTEKKGVLYIKGKRVLKTEQGINSKLSISVGEANLKCLKTFKTFCTSQVALLLQKRFRYVYKDLAASTRSLFEKGTIQNFCCLADRKDKVGASMSKIAEYLGISKSSVKELLAGVAFKKYANIVSFLNYKQISELYHRGFFKEFYYLGWKFSAEHKSCMIYQKLPHVYTNISYLRKQS